MLGTLSYTGTNIKPDQPLSAYQPSEAVKDFTAEVKDAYQTGDEILHRPFNEFNGLSVLDRDENDQKAWLSWNPPESTDPELDWRWTGVRPITRNKVISTAAHLTEQVIIPQVYAQNDTDEEDREAGYVMRTLLEYNNHRSNYEQTFLYAVISGLVNSVTYWKVDYAMAYQEILEGTSSNYTRKQVMDDVLSGFQDSLHTSDEIMIQNPYVFDLQKQPALIHKRKISYDEAQGLYGDHENFAYIQPGIKVIMGEDGLFYEVRDDEDTLVEEVKYLNRRGDCEAVHVNGVYLGNGNVKYNPMQHRDNKNKPKYPYVKFGSEPIDAKRFWAYKSQVAKMSNDQELYDRMWQTAMDGFTISANPPIVTIGAGKIDRSILLPAAVTDMQRGTEINPLNTVVNPAPLMTALQEIERSLSDSSQAPQSQGQQTPTPQTARQSILIQQNAETNLGIMGKMIGSMAREVGELKIDNIIRYQTVGEIAEELGGIPQMKFKTFIMQNRVKNGRKITETIRFTDRFAGQQMTEAQKQKEELQMATDVGDEKELYEVNPTLFSRLQFLITIDSDQLMKKDDAFERAYKLEVYDRAIMDPVIRSDPSKLLEITRDFLLEPLVKGEATKYLPTNTDNILQQIMPQGQNPQGTPPQGNGALPARMMQSSAMESLPITK